MAKMQKIDRLSKRYIDQYGDKVIVVTNRTVFNEGRVYVTTIQADECSGTTVSLTNDEAHRLYKQLKQYLRSIGTIPAKEEMQ